MSKKTPYQSSEKRTFTKYKFSSLSPCWKNFLLNCQIRKYSPSQGCHLVEESSLWNCQIRKYPQFQGCHLVEESSPCKLSNKKIFTFPPLHLVEENSPANCQIRKYSHIQGCHLVVKSSLVEQETVYRLVEIPPLSIVQEENNPKLQTLKCVT